MRLDDWLTWMEGVAATQMLAAVSPVTLVQHRPGFGRRVTAQRGAIIASPVLAAYDPEPDYFFHWFRDSAVVVEALALLHRQGRLGAWAVEQAADFVRFSQGLMTLDGRELVTDDRWRRAVAPDFQQFLRTPEDLAAARGPALAAETRVNPDGTLDISRWNRPQHDGPPLRALALLRWAPALESHPVRPLFNTLLRADLDFARTHWMVPSYDIWEEDLGYHYYTLRVTLAALRQGAVWLRAQGDAATASACDETGVALARRLDDFWDPAAGWMRSRDLASGLPSPKALDIAVILSAIHSGETGVAVHGVGDARLHATLDALDALFDRLYPINHARPEGRGPAMGRYDGDVYYSGGAYYFSSLGAAEFCYRAALATGNPAVWRARGDGYLATVQAYTPASGHLSEQFDQRTGQQTSARHLAWSYAALLTTAEARRAALAAAA